jgi:V/A-type H+/Na+-transporting ATPase subunit E
VKELDTGREKVKKICDVLRRETLEPAEQEAKQIIRQAELRAEEIIKNAKAEALQLKAETLKELEREKVVFTSSLAQASKQTLDSLRELIEKKLFNPELSSVLARPLQDPKVIVDLIQVVVRALEKEGTSADLDVVIPKTVSAREINTSLAQNILHKLKDHSVSVGQIAGGVLVKLSQDNISIDITDEALKEWVSAYVRQDFRKFLFGNY